MKSQPFDMIMFGEDWGGHPSSTQHLAKHLVKNRKILWFNSVGLRRPKLNKHDFQRIYSKIKNAFSAKKNTSLKDVKTPKSLYVQNPLAIPVPQNSIEEKINQISLKRLIEKGLQRHKIDRAVLWTSLPTVNNITLKDHNSLSIYYCCDDFGGLAGVDHEDVLKAEEKLAQSADIIFVTNKKLSNKFSKEKTYLIPHGVDYELFSTPAHRAQDMVTNKKICGFYGAIHDWLDQELIKKISTALPDWKFMFIGPVQTGVSTIEALPNVKLLGERPHHELPSYIQHWDTAILPFVDNDQIRACNPLKLREYMASGTAVISTKFPAAEEYQDYIYVATDVDDFISKITLEDTPQKKKERQELMKFESWQHRAQQIESIINKHLKN